MTPLTASIETHKDRIKLPFSFDVDKMQAEIEQLKLNEFVYYDALPLRSPAHMVDNTLPFPPPADDYADGSWCDWMDTPLLKKLPYIAEVIDTFKAHTTVNLVRLLRLSSGDIVKEHTDPTLGLHIERSVIRLTIPIISKPEVEFFLNDTIVPMKEGECWYLRLTDPHRIVNASPRERINLTIDMIPNEWVQSMILDAS